MDAKPTRDQLETTPQPFYHGPFFPMPFLPPNQQHQSNEGN